VQLKRNCEKLQANKEETEQVRRETESARKFFASLVRTAGEISASVRGIDLEGVVAGQQQAVDGAIGANL
jgi:mitofusin 2